MTVVAFDFDGTLSTAEMTIQLGDRYGVGGEMAALVDQTEREELSVEESLRQRTDLLSGMPESDAEAVLESISLRPGAADLLAALRRSGNTVAIITGSFERGVEAALAAEGVTVDHLIANRLVVENGALTGEIDGPLLEGQKNEALGRILAAEGETAERSIAVGDSAVDLPMLQRAGTAIGFDPDSVVENYCDQVVTSIDRLSLYFAQSGVIES